MCRQHALKTGCRRIWLYLAVLIAIAIASCQVEADGEMPKEKNMKTLTIRWQRLVDEKGETCERCGSTEVELQKAIGSLQKSLGELGIEVVLEKSALDPETCAKDVSQSNRIWVGELPLEEWLSGEVGESPCGFCCEELGGDVECRTVTINGKTYEAIPSELIIKAGLIAGSHLLGTSTGESCCPVTEQNEDDSPCGCLAPDATAEQPSESDSTETTAD